MSKTDIKTLPVDVYSPTKGYITYNPTKIDIIPVALNAKQEYFEKNDNTPTEIPLKRYISKSSHFSYENARDLYYSSHLLNNIEYRNTQNTTKVYEGSNLPLSHNEVNLNPISTNFGDILNPSIKNVLNIPKSSYSTKNTSSVAKNISQNLKEEYFDSNREFCHSFSSIFKDTQNILNGDETSQIKTDENVDVTAPGINFTFIKTEPGSPNLHESNAIANSEEQSSLSNLFLEAYQHVRSGLSDGEHSTNSDDNFDTDYVKSEPFDESFSHNDPDRRNVRTEKNKIRMRMKREIQRQTETDEEREQRLLQMREAARLRRKQESVEKRLERLKRDREKKRVYRAKLKEDEHYDQILAKNRVLMRLRRQDVSFREKERERDRIRHQIKRTNIEYREKEKVKERERKRLSRFLKKYAEQYSGFEHFAHHLFSNRMQSPENIQICNPTLLQN